MRQTAQPVRGKLQWRQLRWRTRAAVCAFFLTATLAGAEIVSRAAWTVAKRVPFFHTEMIWDATFPEMARASIQSAPTSRDDETFDVLILGASVWHRDFGDLAARLAPALERRLDRRVKVWNIAECARTAMDSWEKYRRLADKRFDLVVVYHGINDAFLNNCPSEGFQTDYRHAARFDQIAMLKEHPEHPYFVLPYTLRYAASQFRKQWDLGDQPSYRHREHGRVLKTPPVFEANLTNILDEADRRGDRVLLMSFATYIPADYTEEAFAARTLDYADFRSPLRLWGTPETVSTAVAAHNGIIRRSAARRPRVLYVDQAGTMPDGKENYNDCCHLTPAGCEKYIAQMMKQVDWKHWWSTERRRDSPIRLGGLDRSSK